MNDSREFYNRTADIYDMKHASPTTFWLRRAEGKLIKRFAKGRVLDAGCGTGQWLSPGTVGIDVSEAMLRIARDKAKPPLVQGEIERLPFRDSSFDTVLNMFTTFNKCDWKPAAREMSRVLRPGGFCLLSVSSVWDNNYSFLEKLRARSPPREMTYSANKVKTSHRMFEKKEFIGLLESEGLKLAHFDSVFALQKPRWCTFKGFSLWEKIKLRLERLLPLRQYGCLYLAAFEKRRQ